MLLLQAAENLLQMAVTADSRQGLTLLITVLNPRSRGHVRLRSPDPLDPPLIDPHYLSDEYDMEIAIKGITICVCVYILHPLSRILLVFLMKICEFESNTTSDWLNHMV